MDKYSVCLESKWLGSGQSKTSTHWDKNANACEDIKDENESFRDNSRNRHYVPTMC